VVIVILEMITMTSTKIRPMTEEERKASIERDNKNGWRKCVSCGNASKGTWCGFCLEEE
jgi:CRISPR/Cas system-associated protein Cas10 (large subunit of type III CRISPR-Cas system)